MYCKECGHEIQENSKFCNKCGTKIVENNPYDDFQSEKQDKKAIQNFIVGAIIVAMISLIIYAIYVGYDDVKPYLENALSEKAKTSDITIDFYQEPQFDSVEKYYAILQANEKIENLVIEIDFLDKNEYIIKTERIEIGKVTPGNEYKIKLNQNGIAFDRLDKTTQFRTRVIEGTIIE